jgi:hypothetical protein
LAHIVWCGTGIIDSLAELIYFLVVLTNGSFPAESVDAQGRNFRLGTLTISGFPVNSSQVPICINQNASLKRARSAVWSLVYSRRCDFGYARLRKRSRSSISRRSSARSRYFFFSGALCAFVLCCFISACDSATHEYIQALHCYSQHLRGSN